MPRLSSLVVVGPGPFNGLDVEGVNANNVRAIYTHPEESMATTTEPKPKTGPTETLRREASDKLASKAGENPPRKVASKKAKTVEIKAKAIEGLLFDPHKIAPKGKRLASIFKETSEAKSSATGAHKAAKETLIDWMRETGTLRIPVELGGVRKIIRLEEEDKLVIESAAEPPKAGDGNGKS